MVLKSSRNKMSEPKMNRRKKKSGKGGGHQQTVANVNLGSVVPVQNPSLTAEVNGVNTNTPLLVDKAEKQSSNDLSSDASKTETRTHKQQAASQHDNKQLQELSSNKKLSANVPLKASTEKGNSKPTSSVVREVDTINKKCEENYISKAISGEQQVNTAVPNTEKVCVTQSVNHTSLGKPVVHKQSTKADDAGSAKLKTEKRTVEEAQRVAKQRQKVDPSGAENPTVSSSSKAVGEGTINKKCEETHNVKDISGEQHVVKSVSNENVSVPQSVDRTMLEKQSIAKQSTKDDAAPAKSKAELRAERRAIQEAQRAAKQGNTTTISSSTKAIGVKPVVKAQNKSTSVIPSTKGVAVEQASPAALKKSTSLKQGKLFSHLPAYERNISVIRAAQDGIHPAIVRLGLQYAEGVICGSNARCSALVYALLEVVGDFKTPESKDFSHALNSMHIEKSMKFLEKCRPVSVGMKVVCKKIMEKISELPKDLSEKEAKKQSKEILNNILEDDIIKAHTAIVSLAKNKIADDDVILTYGCSYLVKEILIAAHQNAKFRVVVVDSRPKLEGKSMLNFLIKQGIKCTYVLINAVAHVMQEVTKVFLGAHALLANGYVMSRVGSSQVALVAKAFNKPVLVCCETYKFSELVQTDSFVFNELGNPDDLVETRGVSNPLSDWQTMESLNILNIYYDVTPPDLVTVIINDVHLVPCTSVPVLLRVKPNKK